jgi:hypothetical protein
MDFRGLDLEEMRDVASLLEDGSAKALYKNSLREKAMRKGRIFQPLANNTLEAPRAEEGPPTPALDPVEAAFINETKDMEKLREQLEVDIYGLEQDIRMMTRHLEQKSRSLKDANALLSGREREGDWWDGGDVRPRAQRFPSDNSSTGSPSLQPSPSMPVGSLSPFLGSMSPGVFPAESPAFSPAVSAASNLSFSPMMSVASSCSSYTSATSSPRSCQTLSPSLSTTSPALTAAALGHSGSNLRIPSGTTPPLQPTPNPSVMFVVPTIPFPSSRATGSPSSPPSASRRSPFRNLNKER